MKKILFILAMVASAMVGMAQKDVTTFLGIPVDGYRDEMFNKLKAKGFKVNPYNEEGLTGEFNGTNVNIYISTNNNKVCRIMVCDKDLSDEGEIKIRFNRLCEQFENNQRYVFLADQKLSADEDISYEMLVHSKKYDAIFYQKPLDADSLKMQQEVLDIVSSKYTPEQLENPTEEIRNEITNLAFSILYEKISKKVVWFRIVEFKGEYYITMYYDNEYNKANGEDL